MFLIILLREKFQIGVQMDSWYCIFTECKVCKSAVIKG